MAVRLAKEGPDIMIRLTVRGVGSFRVSKDIVAQVSIAPIH